MAPKSPINGYQPPAPPKRPFSYHLLSEDGARQLLAMIPRRSVEGSQEQPRISPFPSSSEDKRINASPQDEEWCTPGFPWDGAGLRCCPEIEMSRTHLHSQTCVHLDSPLNARPASRGVKGHLENTPPTLGLSRGTRASFKALKQKLHFLQTAKSRPSPRLRVAPESTRRA